MKSNSYKIDISNIYSMFILNEMNNDNNSPISDYEISIEQMNERFPWIENFIKSKNLMNNALYDEDTDTLSYSVVFMPDYVEKSKAINIARRVFPKLKKGMDFHTHGSNFENLTRSKEIMTDAIGETLKSYGVSIENVYTGYWDLVLTIENASSESPNKVIKAFEVFYKAVAYLNNEDPEEI